MVLRHAVNRGKGAALRSGFAQASAPVVLVHDADAEYDARQIARVAAPMLAAMFASLKLKHSRKHWPRSPLFPAKA